MLRIGENRLSYSALAYVAFRVAFRETFEWIVLQRQVDECRDQTGGFLTEIPFLRSVTPRVQLDLLGETWSRLISGAPAQCTLVDESVLYAVCESTAHLAENQPADLGRFLQNGPLQMRIEPDHWLVSRLRALHLSLPIEGEFLMVSQFEDMAPETAREQKRRLGLDESRLESMFHVLGRWHVSPNFSHNLRHLLTRNEIREVCDTFEVQHTD